jgi:hypothetical protein
VTNLTLAKPTPAAASSFRLLHRGHAARFIVERVEKPTDNKTT